MRTAIAILIATLIGQAQAPRVVIEGRVLKAGTQEPIPDVLVTLVPAAPANAAPTVVPNPSTVVFSLNGEVFPGGFFVGPNPLDSPTGVQPTAITDASGHFTLRDTNPGRYSLRAQREGYFAPSLNGVSAPIATAMITLQNGDSSLSRDLLLVKGGVISGRVRDPGGQAVSGMSVSAFTASYVNGRRSWTIARSQSTDDRGEYRIFWLPPGEYYVGATPRNPGAVPGPQDLWLRTFFPGVTDPAATVPIVVRDGREISGTDIDIRAAASPGFKISGAAVNPLARPNPTTGAVDRSIASFMLAPREPGLLDNVNPPSIPNAIPLASRPNGEFEIRNVKPGAYDLYPVAPMLTDPPPSPSPTVPGQPAPVPPSTVVRMIDGTTFVTTGGPAASRRQPTSRTPLTVNGDITDLKIVVNPGIDLSGEVLLTGPVQNLKLDAIRLALRVLDTTPPSFVTLIGAISVDADGKFKVASLPEARYTFQVAGLPEGAYVADIRQGGSSVMDDGFLVDAAALPVQVVLSGGGAMLEGVVETADHKPAANATVVIIPPAARRKNALLYKVATTNEEGRFTIKGIAPGPYKIFAWESIPATAWQNAEYLSRYEDQGRSLTAPSSVGVPLNLIPREDRN